MTNGQASLSALLDQALGGNAVGSLEVETPHCTDGLGERERDFTRSLHGGSIALLTAVEFEELWPAAPQATPLSTMSDDMMREAIKSFHEQLLEAAEEVNLSVDEQQKLAGMIESGRVFANLTVGPAVDFLVHAGLPPRILQPRFVVILSPGSLRVATLGFVGEPIIGDQPEEQRTPFLARLLTQNLFEAAPNSDAPLRLHYLVRAVTPIENDIQACIADEVPELLDISANRKSSCLLGSPTAHSCILIAGVELPRDQMTRRIDRDEDVTLFSVEVTPADGTAAWLVQRRYEEFRGLYSTVRSSATSFVAVSFPRKRFRRVDGERLEARRHGLQRWLCEVLREAQCRDPSLLEPLCEFLEVRRTTPGFDAFGARDGMCASGA
mmetsp:Transcript_48782/g.136527  ORF Transcript_48782/g.136527 Transcript_48782/m.136527 type:complete len:382 (-) Transcript_48782:124-1269(-)